MNESIVGPRVSVFGKYARTPAQEQEKSWSTIMMMMLLREREGVEEDPEERERSVTVLKGVGMIANKYNHSQHDGTG